MYGMADVLFFHGGKEMVILIIVEFVPELFMLRQGGYVMG